MRKTRHLFALAATVLLAAPLGSSPPACHRDDIDRFRAADSVVAAVVTSSRRWQAGATTLHLVAKYRVLESFKGPLASDGIVIVTDTCLDEERPRDRLGYPTAVKYCPGSSGLVLTGVNASDGSPIREGAGASEWVLYLRENRQRGAPELTWLEVSTTSFGGDCGYSREDLTGEERESFDRLSARLPQP